MANLRVHKENKIWQVKVLEKRHRWSKPGDTKVSNYLYTRRGDAVKRALEINTVEVLDFKVGHIEWHADEAFFEEHGSQMLLNRLPDTEEILMESNERGSLDAKTSQA